MSAPTTTAPVICVFDGPRTCSQLFNKLFAAHGQLRQIFHLFVGCSMYGPERMTARLGGSADSKQAKADLAAVYDLHEETYQVAGERLRSTIAEAHEAGKIPWVKDHAICLMQVDLMASASKGDLVDVADPQHNPTMIPDDLFVSMTPIILIRHPALRVPAYYRTQRHVFKEQADEEVFEAMISSRWAKRLFDSYDSKEGFAAPIVVDAEDIVHQTRPLTQKLCALLNIDLNGVQYEWNAVPREQWSSDPIMQGFFKTLLKSDGVQRKGQPAEHDLGIDHEAELWASEFGQETARQLRKVVEKDMPIYENLHQYKLRV